MSKAAMIEFLEFSRQKTLALLESLAKTPDTAKVLGWRPGPGRAHIAWQIMHIAATDDRHVHVRMNQGQPKNAEFVQRFAGGSTPDESIPTLDDIKAYLATSRADLLARLAAVPEADLDKKPNEPAPWTWREWIKVLAWHEAHHQGQAHITFNLCKAAT